MPTWNCTEFESELQQCLDARRPLSSLGLAQSEIRCPHCRGLWEQFKLLEQALVGWNGGSADVDLAEAVVARALLDSEVPLHRHAGPMSVPSGGGEPSSPAPHVGSGRRLVRVDSRRGHQAVVAAAALVLLACLAPLLRQADDDVAGRPRQPDQRIAQGANAKEDRMENRAPERDLQFLFRDAGTAYGVLAREARTTMSGATRFLPTAFPQPRLSGDDTVPDVDEEWIDDWRRDLKPIGDDVHQALSFLLETVAIEDDPSI